MKKGEEFTTNGSWPTPEMIAAGAFLGTERVYSDAEVRNIYLDMQAAAPEIDYSKGAEYQLAERVLRDYDAAGPHGEAVVLARAYMAMVEAAQAKCGDYCACGKELLSEAEQRDRVCRECL